MVGDSHPERAYVAKAGCEACRLHRQQKEISMDDQDTAVPEVRTETRESAVARLGSHWTISGRGRDTVIVEVLGPVEDVDSGYDFSSQNLPAALAKARRDRIGWSRRELSHISDLLGYGMSSITIALARMGVHRRSRSILKLVKDFRTRIQVLEDTIMKLEDGAEQPVERLPPILKLPIPLEIGDTVWEVGYEWAITHGTWLCECRIVRIDACETFEGNPYDASIHYGCKRRATDGVTLPSGDIGFTYDHDDLSYPITDKAAGTTSHLFMTRETAVAHLLEIAGTLALRAAEAEAIARAPDPLAGGPVR